MAISLGGRCNCGNLAGSSQAGIQSSALWQIHDKLPQVSCSSGNQPQGLSPGFPDFSEETGRYRVAADGPNDTCKSLHDRSQMSSIAGFRFLESSLSRLAGCLNGAAGGKVIEQKETEETKEFEGELTLIEFFVAFVAFCSKVSLSQSGESAAGP